MPAKIADTGIVTIRMPKELKRLLEKAAIEDNRNLTSLMLKISTDFIAAKKREAQEARASK